MLLDMHFDQNKRKWLKLPVIKKVPIGADVQTLFKL